MVVLADLNRKWHPKTHLFQFAGFESKLVLPTCKLIEHLDTSWKDDVRLPVQVARAQIEALRTRGKPLERLEAKWTLVRGLYRKGCVAEEIRQTFHLIDWMMRLTDELD